MSDVGIDERFARRRRYLPHGVTGDGRFAPPNPIVFRSAKGKFLRDVDGTQYLDLHCGFGSVALGYANETVDDAVRAAMKDVGNFVGVANEVEAALAERLVRILPGVEVVALSGGGGTDSLAHAVRIARAFTDRTRVAKLEGGYNGWHSDLGVSTKPVLTDASPVGLPNGIPNSKGILPAVTAEVSVATANDKEALQELFEREGEQLAALIIEPVLYSPGCIEIEPDYMALARELCTQHGTLLIFDEIMSGFRNGMGGAGAAFGIEPDLGAYGKAMANGYIIAALGGRRELLEQLSPVGGVFYSGTFNGHPISSTAALATLDIFERDDVPTHLASLGERVAAGINQTISRESLQAVCQQRGGVWTLYFKTTSVKSYRDLARTMTAETEQLNEDFRAWLLTAGIFMQKRHMNRCFISSQHTEADIDRIIDVVSSFLEARADALAQ